MIKTYSLNFKTNSVEFLLVLCCYMSTWISENEETNPQMKIKRFDVCGDIRLARQHYVIVTKQW